MGSSDGLFVYLPLPISSATPFGESLCNTHGLSNTGKNLIIVAGLRKGFCQFRHGNHIGVARGYRDISPFHRRGAGQHDISVFGK